MLDILIPAPSAWGCGLLNLQLMICSIWCTCTQFREELTKQTLLILNSTQLSYFYELKLPREHTFCFSLLLANKWHLLNFSIIVFEL